MKPRNQDNLSEKKGGVGGLAQSYPKPERHWHRTHEGQRDRHCPHAQPTRVWPCDCSSTKAPRQFPGQRNWFPTPFPQQMMLKQLSNLGKIENLTSEFEMMEYLSKQEKLKLCFSNNWECEIRAGKYFLGTQNTLNRKKKMESIFLICFICFLLITNSLKTTQHSLSLSLSLRVFYSFKFFSQVSPDSSCSSSFIWIVRLLFSIFKIYS